MATDLNYSLERDLPGVLNAAIDGGGCHWCGRQTPYLLYGHDGFCPVPALFTMNAEQKRLRAALVVYADESNWHHAGGFWIWNRPDPTYEHEDGNAPATAIAALAGAQAHEVSKT